MKEIFVKDESTRFNLKAFKVLGGSYAAACLVACELGISPDNIDFTTLAGDETRDRIGRITLAAATDGALRGPQSSWAWRPSSTCPKTPPSPGWKTSAN